MAIQLKKSEIPIAVVPAPANLVFNLPQLEEESTQPVVAILVLHDLETNSVRWVALGEWHQTTKVGGIHEVEHAEFPRNETQHGKASVASSAPCHRNHDGAPHE